MAARKKQRGPVYLVKEPNWAQHSLLEKEEDRRTAYRNSEYFIHHEISDKEQYASFRKWVKEASGWDKKTIALVLAAPDHSFLAICKYTWFYYKTGYMTDSQRQYLDKKLEYLMDKGQQALDEKKEKQEKPKATVVRLELPLFIGAVDSSIDNIMERKKHGTPEQLMNSVKLNKEEMAEAIAEYSGLLDELEEVQRVRKIRQRNDWDEQLVEGYSHIKKADTQKLVDWLKELMGLLSAGKVRKVVRRKKPQDPRKIVNRLRYMQADKDLGIASINPVDILGATELWVYDTKRKRIGLYMSKGEGGLGVKGTAPQGYDTELSYEKTLRKPDEQLPLIMKKSRNALHEVVGKIRGKKMGVKLRVNANMLLLKVQ
jgi:hypothetical protein